MENTAANGVGRRTRLADELPLATPFMVQVFPVYACNFRCNYCVFSVPRASRGYISSQKIMDEAVYRKGIDDLKRFPGRLKMLRFAGTGEPLLHPRISSMVEYAAEAGIAESIEIVTNGALLSPELSRDLVNAGVSRIRVSVQGVTREKYAETTQNYDDIETIVANVSYLYKNRGDSRVYVKIIDSAMETDEEEEVFMRIFSEIADVVAVEHLLPATPLIDYSRIAGRAAMDRTQNGQEILSVEVCPQPFYMMQINPDGKVAPCCGMESPVVVGDVTQEGLDDIWRGGVLNRFRTLHLSGKRSDNRVCASCLQFRHAMFPEDYLDGDAQALLAEYS